MNEGTWKCPMCGALGTNGHAPECTRPNYPFDQLVSARRDEPTRRLDATDLNQLASEAMRDRAFPTDVLRLVAEVRWYLSRVPRPPEPEASRYTAAQVRELGAWTDTPGAVPNLLLNVVEGDDVFPVRVKVTEPDKYMTRDGTPVPVNRSITVWTADAGPKVVGYVDVDGFEVYTHPEYAPYYAEVVPAPMPSSPKSGDGDEPVVVTKG